MKKNMVAFLLVAGLSCGLLAGCGSSKDAAQGSDGTAQKDQSGSVLEEAADTGITLRFIDVNTSREREDYFEDLFKAFRAETGISVTYEGVQWDYAADRLTELGGAGELPDVMTVHDAWMGQFTEEGWILPLTEFYEEQLEEDLNQAARMSVDQQVSLYGEVYRIPDGLTNAGIFYRKDWAEEIGYEIPTGADWTWDAFFDLERALTDVGEGRYGASFRGARGGFDVVQNMLVTLTEGRTYDEEGNFLLMSEDCVFMFEEFCSLYLDGYAPKDALNWGFTELVNHFVDGVTGTLYNNTDVVPTLLEEMEEDQWGVLPVPTAPDGHVYNSVSYSYAYSVAADSDYPEEAKQLIAYMSDAENNLNYCKIAGMVPIRNDVGDDPMFGEEGPYAGFIEQLEYKNLAFATAYGAFDYTDMHQEMMHTEIQKYLLGEQSAKDVLVNIGTELESRMKKYLRENPGTKVEEPFYPEGK